MHIWVNWETNPWPTIVFDFRGSGLFLLHLSLEGIFLPISPQWQQYLSPVYYPCPERRLPLIPGCCISVWKECFPHSPEQLQQYLSRIFVPAVARRFLQVPAAALSPVTGRWRSLKASVWRFRLKVRGGIPVSLSQEVHVSDAVTLQSGCRSQAIVLSKVERHADHKY